MKANDETDLPTLEYYSRESPVYTASGPGGVCRHLHHFLSLLRPSGKILELGCGGGRDSQEMIKLGFDVIPTDGVPEIARKAELHLGVPVRIMRFDELTIVEEFDAVWAHASLLHVPKPSLPKTLARIHRTLKPGGLHFASFKSGGDEGRDKSSRYFNFVSKEQLLEAYEMSGKWEIVDIEEYVSGGYDNGQGPWIAITASKT